jgi:hypothetical protein
MLCTTTITVLALAATAAAQKAETKKEPAKPAAAAAPAGPPAPPTAGPETKALGFLNGNMTMTGTLKANAMGPGSPEMPSHGTHKCHWTMNNLWLACDIEDITGTGAKSMKWMGHVVAGWDFEAKGYRGFIVDNMGTSGTMTGKIDGTKLVWDSGEAMMMGQPLKYRITMDFTDPKAIKFTDERSMKGGPYVLAEEAVMKPAK